MDSPPFSDRVSASFRRTTVYFSAPWFEKTAPLPDVDSFGNACALGKNTPIVYCMSHVINHLPLLESPTSPRLGALAQRARIA